MNDTSDNNNLPSYAVRRVDKNLIIDGIVDQYKWASAEPVELLPVTGAHPGVRQATTLRLLWSASHLFVAFECRDRDVWGTYARRDGPLYEEEVVEAFISPTGDLRNYYEFEVSPLNVVFDARVDSPALERATMVVDPEWDCADLRTAVVATGPIHREPPALRRGAAVVPERVSGWAVEMAIPFAAFPEAGPPSDGSAWRANFYRIERADSVPEYSAWVPTLAVPPDFHVPARFGWLRFVA